MADESVASEAQRLVTGARQGDYGHPLDDFGKTALIWQAILGIPVTPEQVALCMVGVKISREVNKPKRDNLVDGIGYLSTIELIQQERARRAKAAGRVSGMALAALKSSASEPTVPTDPRTGGLLSEG